MAWFSQNWYIPTVLLILVASGCERPSFGGAEGTILLDGKSLADVEVQFIPESGSEIHSKSVSAYTNAEGKYTIPAKPYAGITVGRYRVCLNDATLMMPIGGAPPQTDLTSGEPGQLAARKFARRSRLPEIYSDVTRTPYQMIEIDLTVKSLDFDLKSKTQSK
jgi:hypothetical protein